MQDISMETQLEFIRKLDGMKSILRMNILLDESRREDDAQHSWHAAMMAMVMQEYAAEPIDITRVVPMLLVHDLVEIGAGDTYAYDEVGNQSKEKREREAADALFGSMGEQGRQMRALWEEFEEAKTADARFAAAMDRIQPLLGNYWSEGKVWKENRIDYSQVYVRNEVTRRIVPRLWEKVDTFLQDAVRKGMLTDREHRVLQDLECVEEKD